MICWYICCFLFCCFSCLSRFGSSLFNCRSHICERRKYRGYKSSQAVVSDLMYLHLWLIKRLEQNLNIGIIRMIRVAAFFLIRISKLFYEDIAFEEKNRSFGWFWKFAFNFIHSIKTQIFFAEFDIGVTTPFIFACKCIKLWRWDFFLNSMRTDNKVIFWEKIFILIYCGCPY